VINNAIDIESGALTRTLPSQRFNELRISNYDARPLPSYRVPARESFRSPHPKFFLGAPERRYIGGTGSVPSAKIFGDTETRPIQLFTVAFVIH